MARRKGNSKFVVFLGLLCIISLMFNYLFWQENNLYKEKIHNKNGEIKQLRKEIELGNIKKDNLQSKPDDIIQEKQDELDNEYGLVKLKSIIPSITEDIKYATEDNFVGKQVYPDNSIAVLRKDTALKLKQANKIFQKDGYTIKVFDAYRPLHVQYALWEVFPVPGFVADPEKGSKHNRGAAVDITLLDRDGNEIEMGTDFDNFTERAAYDYPGHTEIALKNMKYLRDVMEEAGFTGISKEWWHFDDVEWKKYEVLDISFDEFGYKE